MHVANDSFFVSSKSYEILEMEYSKARSNLLPHSYHFLIMFSEVALQEGRIRRSIELTREALSYAVDSNSKAYVYLTLARQYRMLIEMQNTRSELRRGFKELGMQYPKSGILSFISAASSILVPLSYKKKEQVDLHAHSGITSEKLAVALYEEASLSTYYMIDSPLLLLQISLRVRKIVSRIGPSIEMLNYLAATATMFAIYKRKHLAYWYLRLAKKIVRLLNQPDVQAKYRSWEILTFSYLDKATKSSNLIEKLLIEQKKDLSLYTLRLLCTTLSTNYTLRGKMIESVAAIDNMLTPYDYTCTKIFSCNKTFIEWYKIAALSFLGKHDEANLIIDNSRAIFTSIDEEKWQLTLYLGNLLIHHYISPVTHYKEVEIILERFKALHLFPKKTFIEAQFFWVGKAYLLFKLYDEGHVEFMDVVHAVQDVNKNSRFQETRCHYYILKAQLYVARGLFGQAKKYIRKAKILAHEADNDWVLYESDKILMIVHFKENEVESALKVYGALKLMLTERTWKGCLEVIESLVSKYKKI